MTELDVRFLPHADLSPGLRSEFDTLDRLAFAQNEEEEDPDFPPIQWATPDWVALGYLQDRLVTQLCLLWREITVATEKILVAGLGGMATHPQFQHQGLGSALLAATASFMRDTIQVPFGLLICADETARFYQLSHWQIAADHLYYTQDHERRMLKPCVMILQLTVRPWPAGEIDLCGLLW
ncbi:MAG: GNAT family N-acetyltransferase [Syntrophothermus sp.]